MAGAALRLVDGVNGFVRSGVPYPLCGVGRVNLFGLFAELARRINKEIREEKFKVKVQIEGDKLRVFSPSRDELQRVIAFVKGNDYGIPLQFTNRR